MLSLVRVKARQVQPCFAPEIRMIHWSTCVALLANINLQFYAIKKNLIYSMCLPEDLTLWALNHQYRQYPLSGLKTPATMVIQSVRRVILLLLVRSRNT